MLNKRRFFAFLMTVILTLSIGGMGVSAKSNKKSDTKTVKKSDVSTAKMDGSFYVQPVIPANQLDKKVSYFDLLMKPAQTQTVSMMVINRANRTLTVNVEANNAYTKNPGMITYDNPNQTLYKQNMNFQTLIVGDKKKTVTLKKGESKLVNFKVRMPSQKFDGIVLGGFNASALFKAPKTNKQATINTRLSLVTGIVLQTSKTKVKPEVTFGDAKIASMIDSSGVSQKGITTQLINNTKMNVSKMQITTNLKRLSPGSKTYKKIVQKNLQMAPNSDMKYFIPVKDLEAGTYELTMDVTASDGVKQHYVKKLIIPKGLKGNIEVSNYIPWWTWIVGALVVIAIVLGGVVLYLRHKEKNPVFENPDEDEEDDDDNNDK